MWKQPPYKVCNSPGSVLSALEKLVEIPTPQMQTVTISNWYLPPKNSHYLQKTGFDLNDLKVDLKLHEVICADLNALDQVWDQIANPDERDHHHAETVMNANKTFLNDSNPTRQDPATGSFFSPDVTVVHAALRDKYDWQPIYSLSSDHHPIILTLHLSAEKMTGTKRLVWD